MALRYRKRLALFPGFAVNIGKRGFTSVSVGGRGAHVTYGRRGRRATIGLPGTGLSYTVAPHRRRRAPAARHGSILGGVVALFLLYLLFRVLAGV
jgi:Protein of unknown function (DUF4236)